MSKHLNKYYLREKEYLNLIREKNFIINYTRTRRYFRLIYTNTRLYEIDKKLNTKFISYYWTNRYYKKNTLKKKINKIIRLKNKKQLRDFILYDKDVVYDKYPCRYWY
jgi:hypothetical protein